MKDIIIGIDLGTTNSLVAFCDAAGPHCLHPGQRQVTGAADETAEQLSPLVPSVVHFRADGTRLVGTEARKLSVFYPLETVYSIKRLMGVGWQEAQKEQPFLPYVIAPGADKDIVQVQVHGQAYTPQEISALILREVKRRADAYFGCDVRKAVITVPAYFDDSQRQATRDAGRIAGLEVMRIVNEPTAAALAYGLGITQPTGTVAVYDLGGGTFDISIMSIENGVFQTLATHGDTHLGGDDFDREIIGLIQREIRSVYGTELQFPPSTQQALREFAEATKIRLSTEASAKIEIDLGQGRVYQRTLMRAEFEALCMKHVAETLDHCRTALKLAGKKPADIDQVVMVGGMTRMPLVLKEVEGLFGRAPYTAVNPDEVVALGAAVQASILAGVRRDVLLLDVVPLSLGVETMGGAVGKLIMANTRIPCAASEMFTTYAEGQTAVKIHVLQGERELAANCRSLGQFELRGLPPMPAGLPKIRVQFLVDANGILNVSAREERSGAAASIQVIPTHGLTADQVQAMTEASVTHAREDMLNHRLIDLRNQVELDTRSIRKAVQSVGAQLPPEQLAEITGALASLDQVARQDEPDAIWAALERVNRMTVHLAELAIKKSLQG
jgi:molecular chaperone DnaK